MMRGVAGFWLVVIASLLCVNQTWAQKVDVPGIIGAFMGMAIQEQQQRQQQQEMLRERQQLDPSSPQPDQIAPQDEAFFTAKTVFERLPLEVRYDQQMLLATAGYWNAVSMDDYGHWLYSAICQFQEDSGYQQTGILTPEEMSRLHQIADPVLAAWNLQPLRDRSTGISLWIPKPAGTKEVETQTGTNFSAPDGSLQGHFRYLRGAKLKQTYNYLVEHNSKSFTVRYKTYHSDFFVVSAGNGETENYSRYQAVQGGLLGFSLFWKAGSETYGKRLATIMSDLFRSSVSGQAERRPPSVSPEFEESMLERQKAAQEEIDQEKKVAEAKEAALQEQAKQEQLEKLVPAAKELIQEASEFVANNPGHPKMLEFVQAIATLNGALTAADPDKIAALTTALSSSLQAEPQFQKLLADRQRAKDEEAAKHLADTVELANNQARFITAYVSQNPTATPTLSLMALLNELTNDLKSPSYETLAPVTQKVDLAIREAQLEAPYLKSLAHTNNATAGAEQNTSAELSSKTSSGASGQPVEKVVLPATAKNKFLLDGDLGDFVVLYNVSPRAPHVVKNLRGEIVFDNDSARACFFEQSAASDGENDDLEQALSAYHVSDLQPTPSVCAPDQLLSYDVIAVTRGVFLRQKPDYALQLIKAVEDDEFEELATLSAQQMGAARDFSKSAARQIETDVRNAAKLGFGLVLVDNGSSVVCVAVNDKVEGHRQFLLSASGQLARELHGSPSVTQTNLDEAYVSIKRHQCGAVYASAGDLKTVIGGLERDAVRFRLSTVWATPKAIDDAETAALNTKRIEDEQALAKRRKIDEQAQLAALKAKDEAASQAKQQETLRAKYGNIANSLSASIAQRISEFVEHPAKDAGDVADQFPSFVAWYTAAQGDRWELQSVDSSLADYGVSDWKDRKLDTVFSEIKIHMKNRVLGDYKDSCYVFGEIIDNEFQVTRDPVEASCNDLATVNSWEGAHDFQSRWIVN